MARDPPLPAPEFWRLATLAVEADDSLSLHLEPPRAEAVCPACGAPSRRRQRRYEKRALELPGAEPLAAWLRRHPGVEVLVRDRVEAYEGGRRSGAVRARWRISVEFGNRPRSGQ